MRRYILVIKRRCGLMAICGGLLGSILLALLMPIWLLVLAELCVIALIVLALCGC